MSSFKSNSDPKDNISPERKELQAVWDKVTILVKGTPYKEFGDTFLIFEMNKKKYKIEIKEIK